MTITTTSRMLLERAGDLGNLRDLAIKGRESYLPDQLSHVYVKLEFDDEHERAKTADLARGFLASVARASDAAQQTATRYGGMLLEVQGSTIHVALPMGKGQWYSYAGDLHSALRVIFHDGQKRVKGWRMVSDGGRTMVVAAAGVHGDHSFVSIGNSANRPAKHLYRQLELPEEDRALKRHHIGWYDSGNQRWQHRRLDEVPSQSTEAVKSISESVRRGDPRLDFFRAIQAGSPASARAMPLASPGAPGSPRPDRPHTYFGWVIRADLDGFTRQVEACFECPEELAKLAAEFRDIMQFAAKFVANHAEAMIQLPWAGDNFTAAVLFASKEEYESALPARLVEASLDFEKEMEYERSKNPERQLGDWAHGVAGGTVHGNTGGNVYLAGIEFGERRFLVGAGEGIGRSAEAISDIGPGPVQMALYRADWESLDRSYREQFKPAINSRGQTSTLFLVANLDDLAEVRYEFATRTKTIAVHTSKSVAREIEVRPHFR